VGKGRWQEIRNSGLCFARGETSCGLACVMVTRGSSSQAGVAILISDKVDFKPTLVKQVREGHFTLINGQYIKRK
jgi:hypothetical protein